MANWLLCSLAAFGVAGVSRRQRTRPAQRFICLAAFHLHWVFGAYFNKSALSSMSVEAFLLLLSGGLAHI